MALLQVSFRSHVLGMSSSMNVLLPSAPAPGAPDSCPPPHRCLWLLHGLSDDHTAWHRYTSIERYLTGRNLAVLMPNCHRSFYADMANGYRYWTYLSEELPALAARMFPLSTRREDTFAAGLSMGGYGAFKLALRQPHRFAAAASLSGALIRDGRELKERGLSEDWRLVFGEGDDVPPQDDLPALARELAGSASPRPALYAWCGTEDYLHRHNLAFRDHARRIGLEMTYEEGPGDHQWVHWDRQIQRVLDWLPLE